MRLLMLFYFGGASSLMAQNFNTGFSGGPVFSFTSLNRKDGALLKGQPGRVNIHLSIHGQYLFDDQFGLESGIAIASKSMNLKTRQDEAYSFHLDAFTFPFLAIFKTSLPADPWKNINYLFGLTVENQYYIKTPDNITIKSRKSFLIPNLTIGSRISFKQGELGRIELGLLLNYLLLKQYQLQLKTKDPSLDLQVEPKIHEARLQIVYFFMNSIVGQR